MSTGMKDLPDTCLEIENHLPLWVGGDLDPETLRAVDEHLVRCTRCAERGAKARGARAVLREGLTLEVERIGTGLDPWPRVRDGLRREGLLQPSTKAPATRGPSVVRWATAAAVLFALAFAWIRLTQSTAMKEIQRPSPIALGPKGVPVVVQPAGLRHLSPSEHRLRETAQIFGAPDDSVLGAPFDPNMGSPAGLERPITVPPR